MGTPKGPRAWVCLLAVCGAAFLLPPRASAGEGLVKRTYTYKTVGDVKVQADVYRPDDTQVRPVLVWLHGGALIVGSRTAVPKDLLELCRAEGYALASLDYRLAPEVKLPAIIEDLRDAFRWLHEQGPKLFHADPERVAVAGGSAGGYLTLMAGLTARPRPRALVAYWGYGDVDGDWYTQPSAFYRKQPLVSKEEADRAVGGKVLTGTEGSTAAQRARGRFYLYLRQHGLWTREVTGFDPQKERARLDLYCPVRNVTADYPPTLLVHGTEDTDVPYEQSAAMAKELARHKVPHELVTVPGAGHGLSGGDKKQAEQARRKALAFLRAHLQAGKPPAATEGLGEEGYADSDGVKIHYVTLGKGPLLILIHGFPDYWYSWRDQMPALAKHFQVVAIDQRGYNKSGQPKGVENYALDRLVGDVEAVLKHFKRDKAVLVGHDWGGLVAWTFAMTRPGKTDRLVVLNLPHPKGMLRELANNPQQQKNSQYARNFQAAGAAAKIKPEMLVFWVKEPEAREHYLKALRRSSMEGMLAYYQANYPKEPYKDDRTFPPVKCPVLMLHGLKDPYLLPGALNDTWKWVEKDLTIVTIPDAGHFVHRDAPALVTRRILRWLTEGPDR
jgi:pimeloyl-ACP methyl ester carboxylesterase